MKRFSCAICGNEVHFQSDACINCASDLGFCPETLSMVPIDPNRDLSQRKLCRNSGPAGCNWLLPLGQTEGFCVACRHNRIVPDTDFSGNMARWREIEMAKRKLIYALLRWSLPHPTIAEDTMRGLAFDFLSDLPNADGSVTPVSTGHQDGLITLNIAEGDDLIRTERRTALDEPYRTIIGHMRHEIGHYYWDYLVSESPQIVEFRALFGDERQDYTQALQRHYEGGPPFDWNQSFISAYASAHPWEDFAETWAHWMHIVDGLETAWAYGIRLVGEAEGNDPYKMDDVGAVIDAWVPLTVAINNMNRGMGQPDLYPFVLSVDVIQKLRFINQLIHGASKDSSRNLPIF